MRKLLAAIAALEMPLASHGHAEDGARHEDFYHYLSRVAVSVPNTPFISTAPDQAAFISWTDGGAFSRRGHQRFEPSATRLTLRRQDAFSCGPGKSGGAVRTRVSYGPLTRHNRFRD
jgi:hypothetical protein